MSKPNVLVIGAGGVGVVTAYSLAFNESSTVSLVVRSDYEHVFKTGYTIHSCDYGEITNWKPDFIYKNVENASNSDTFFDYVVVTTKNIPDGPVHSRVSNIIEPVAKSNHNIDPLRQTNVLLVQNGIDIELELIEKFDAATYNLVLLSGIQMIGSTKIGPGEIHQLGKDNLFVGGFDQNDKRTTSAAKKYVEIYLNEGHNSVQFEPRVRYARWKKLLYNAAINTTTALVELDVPRSLEFGANQSGTEKFIYIPAMKEIIEIAASEGIVIEEEFIDFFLNISKSLMFKPSMCVDREKSQLMELEVILGNPIKIARQNHVPTPTLSMLYNLLILVQAKLKEKKKIIKFDEQSCKLVK